MFNVGIIGYGKIGKIRHKILSKIKYVNIISICEENLDKKNYENIFFTNKASEVINNKLIDTIFISVPNYLNKKFTIDSLKKKKNVFCEKPPALNSLEMKEIIKSFCAESRRSRKSLKE